MILSQITTLSCFASALSVEGGVIVTLSSPLDPLDMPIVSLGLATQKKMASSNMSPLLNARCCVKSSHLLLREVPITMQVYGHLGSWKYWHIFSRYLA